MNPNKFTKEEVEYGPSSNPSQHRCGICTYLERLNPGEEPHKYECKIVEGSIDEMAGCKKFDVDLIKAANDKITLSSNPPEEK